jgi:hypothetical protein
MEVLSLTAFKVLKKDAEFLFKTGKKLQIKSDQGLQDVNNNYRLYNSS